jgi:rhamnosyltransferase
MSDTKDYQALYVFYEKDGDVTPDVIFYLQELQKVILEILVIVKGKISPDGREELERLGVKILVEEVGNNNLSSWKVGLEEIGWDVIAKKDGLLLCDSSCFGPVYPFSEMFATMARKQCDFWGINRHQAQNHCLGSDDSGNCELGYLQGFFLFFEERVLQSRDFRRWWDNIGLLPEDEQEFGYCEVELTKYLEDAGYRSESYMDFTKYNNLIKGDASLLCCDIQTIEDRNPLIRKSIFNTEYKEYLSVSRGNQVSDLLKHLCEKTNYNTDYIWEWILRHDKLSCIHQNLHLNYILPTEGISEEKDSRSVALLMYVYYEDLIDYCYNYASAMPGETDVYLVVSNLEMKKKCLDRFSGLGCSHVEVRIMLNRGRDVAAYLIAGRDVFGKYDYVCCVHDKKSPTRGESIEGFNFSEHCFQSLLYNKTYVNQVLEAFEKNPRLGMLVPPILNFGHFSSILGCETEIDIIKMRDVYKMLACHVQLDEQSVIPFGSMFWVRGKSFLPMFRYDWKHEDFPTEPCPSGCTILHAF